MRRPAFGPPGPAGRPTHALLRNAVCANSTTSVRRRRLMAPGTCGGCMKERQLTTAAYITLGLLTSRDWSAYQLAEQVGRGVDQLWPRADRQRYITPKILLEQGLVTSWSEPSGKRTRTMYSITPAGREELTRWL